MLELPDINIRLSQSFVGAMLQQGSKINAKNKIALLRYRGDGAIV